MTERRRRITDIATHPDGCVTMRQVTEYYNVDRRTVLKWAENGDLPGHKLPDGEWRFRIDDVRTFDAKTRIQGPERRRQASP